jgi:hypothetical protein
MKSLREDPACEPALCGFLSYILFNMLVVDPAKRDGSSSVVKELRKLAGISNKTGRMSSKEVSELSEYLIPVKETDTTTTPVR